jgi:GT2 family glycosyltransferase
VVPFRGEEAAAVRLVSNLEALEFGPDDELIVADNSDEPALRSDGRLRVVRADGERSSYHARNVGAAGARGEWLLFIDADCVPAPRILGAYFAPPPGDQVGALAGAVLTDPAQRSFLARYAADRSFLDQADGLHTAGNAAATANLLVRRAAFEELGGFAEGIRSGGDVDLCRRLMAAGWSIERRPVAAVRHLHREALPDLLGSIARYAAGARWLNERYPGTAPRWPLAHGLALCVRRARDVRARDRLFALERGELAAAPGDQQRDQPGGDQGLRDDPAHVDRRLPAHLPFGDHVRAHRPGAEPETAAAARLAFRGPLAGAASSAASDRGRGNHGHAVALVWIAVDALHRDRIARRCDRLLDVHLHGLLLANVI